VVQSTFRYLEPLRRLTSVTDRQTDIIIAYAALYYVARAKNSGHRLVVKILE